MTWHSPLVQVRHQLSSELRSEHGLAAWCRYTDRVTWRPLLVQATVSVLVLLAILFVPAGTLHWTRGWIFLGVFVALVAAASAFMWRANPELFAARSRIQEGTKSWDRILVVFLLLGIIAIPAVAALDDGRFHWSSMSWPFVGVGYLLLVAGTVFSAWAESVNRFFELGVRIQTDRGHRVIDTGPYALIRHPGYVGALVLFAGVALSLGSWWALVAAAFAAAVLVLRTAWEDRVLQAELPGYADYARRVRSRLVPGVW